jgi:hypothetical protein
MILAKASIVNYNHNHSFIVLALWLYCHYDSKLWSYNFYSTGHWLYHTVHFCKVVRSKLIIEKIEIVTTKVSKEDFLFSGHWLSICDTEMFQFRFWAWFQITAFLQFGHKRNWMKLKKLNKVKIVKLWFRLVPILFMNNITTR